MYIRVNQNLSFGLFCLTRKSRILKSVCLNRAQILSTFLHLAFNFSSFKRVKLLNITKSTSLLFLLQGTKWWKWIFLWLVSKTNTINKKLKKKPRSKQKSSENPWVRRMISSVPWVCALGFRKILLQHICYKICQLSTCNSVNKDTQPLQRQYDASCCFPFGV